MSESQEIRPKERGLNEILESIRDKVMLAKEVRVKSFELKRSLVTSGDPLGKDDPDKQQEPLCIEEKLLWIEKELFNELDSTISNINQCLNRL